MGISENDITSDIRVTVKGIYKNRALNKLLYKNMKIDLESFRECFGYVTSSEKEISLTKDNQSLLGMDDENLDDIFAEDSLSNSGTTKKSGNNSNTSKNSDIKKRKKSDIDEGAFNSIVIKLKEGIDQKEAVNKLNNVLTSEKLQCRAMPWQKSFKLIADNINLFRTILEIFVYFIFFVAIIVIVNTLSMTAMERSSEIGMMRAIGAKKSFISKMFIAETSLLTFIFGLLGMAAGTVLVFIVASAGIPATTEMMEFLFCNETLQPVINLQNIIKGIIQLLFVTLLSIIYPTILARRIIPLVAINRD